MKKLYDRTRDEQELDERYEWERPFLQLPLPLPEFEFREPPTAEEEEEKKEDRRVIIIDL